MRLSTSDGEWEIWPPYTRIRPTYDRRRKRWTTKSGRGGGAESDDHASVTKGIWRCQGCRLGLRCAIFCSCVISNGAHTRAKLRAACPDLGRLRPFRLAERGRPGRG